MSRRDFTRGFFLGQAVTKERLYGKNPNVFNPTSAAKEAKAERARLKGSRRKQFVSGLEQGMKYFRGGK